MHSLFPVNLYAHSLLPLISKDTHRTLRLTSSSSPVSTSNPEYPSITPLHYNLYKKMGVKTNSFPVTMNHHTFTHSLLALELPDNTQALFTQQPKTPDTFHSFRHLPTELRLQIWRSAFPRSRKVCISKEKRVNGAPSTLFINRESRDETLRYYRVIKGRGTQVLCFRSNYDVLFFDLGHTTFKNNGGLVVLHALATNNQ